jgi:hypothetical protein
VATSSGANPFTIDSNLKLMEMKYSLGEINEINAIAQLKDVSRTDE